MSGHFIVGKRLLISHNWSKYVLKTIKNVFTHTSDRFLEVFGENEAVPNGAVETYFEANE